MPSPNARRTVPERQTLLGTVTELEARAARYFGKVSRHAKNRSRHSDEQFFAGLPAAVRNEADQLTGQVVALMEPALSLVRQSPGLTSADQHDVAISIKEMRSALRLHSYKYWDIEVLHDEGTVLGVQPPRQSEFEASPEEAAIAFKDACKGLVSILELAIEVNGSDLGTAPVVPRIHRASKPGTAFIMMAMDRRNAHLEDVCNTVKRCFMEFDITAVRADDIEHEGLITSRILEEIQTAEFLFADLTGERPSVYYELGYAHAIQRRVILFREEGARIHFDVAGYNCPEYRGLSDLERQLKHRLVSITGKMETSTPKIAGR